MTNTITQTDYIAYRVRQVAEHLTADACNTNPENLKSAISSAIDSLNGWVEELNKQ